MSRRFASLLYRSALVPLVSGLLLSSGCTVSKESTSEEVIVSEGYAKAKALYEKQNYAEASVTLETLLFTSKATALEDDLLFLLAQSYYGSGQYLLAAEIYQRLLREIPSSPYARTAQFMAARSYEHISPPVELDQQDTGKAIENFAIYMDVYSVQDSTQIKSDVTTYTELLKINPDNPDYKKGYELAKSRYARLDSLRYSERAITALRQKLAMNRLLIARQYVKLGKLQAAVIFYDEILQRYPDTTLIKDAQKEKIEVLVKREKWYDASQNLDEYLSKYPDQQESMKKIAEVIAAHPFH